MNRSAPLALALMLAVAPLPALAHGDKIVPLHGGQVTEAGDNQIELVLGNGEVQVFVSDHAGKPVASEHITGKASVLGTGGKIDIALKPAGDNKLTGTGAVTAGVKATAIVALSVNGKALSARFTSPESK